MPSDTSTETDIELATRLATEAGERLAELREKMFSEGADQRQIRDAGDMLSHHFITSELARDRPEDAVLSEEGVDDHRRFDVERVWIVDPLDGTREFSEQGRVDWAVHVALWENGAFGPSAVSLPALARTLTTDPPAELVDTGRDRPRLITSRSRAPQIAAVVATVLGAEAITLGSAGAKAMAVVLGDADIYVHAGGQYQWDSAAPAAVAQAAGLHVSRVDGTPLFYNGRDPWLPDLLVCRKEYAKPVLDAIWR